MARGLMLECKNHGGINCNTIVARFAFAQELKNGEGPELLPVGQELEQLDAICEECEFFESREI